MATRTVPKILGAVVEAVWPWSRSPRHRHRSPPINRTNGRGKSVVARSEDSWRAENARHRHLRAHRLPHSTKARPTAQPDLEDFPAQSCRSNGIDRLLYCVDVHDEGIVPIYRAGTWSSPGAAFQCDRASDCGLDGATDCRGVRRSRRCPLSYPRSGQHFTAPRFDRESSRWEWK